MRSRSWYFVDMQNTTTPAKAKAYYRMAAVEHAKGNHTLGNHWAARAKQIEQTHWHDMHIAPAL